MSFGIVNLTHNNIKFEEFYSIEKHEKGIVLEILYYNYGNNPITGDYERYFGYICRWAIPYEYIKNIDINNINAEELWKNFSKKKRQQFMEKGYRTLIWLNANTVFYDDCMNIDFDECDTSFRLKKEKYHNIANLYAELVGQMSATTEEMKKAIECLNEREFKTVGDLVLEGKVLNS